MSAPRPIGVILPPGWPRPSGYSNGFAAAGTIVAVGGQIGWDPRSEELAEGFARQVGRALDNVVAIVRAAGGDPEHIVRLTWFVTDREAYLAAREEIGAAYRELFGAHYPAMSVILVEGLLEPGALVEIEATAVIPAAK